MLLVLANNSVTKYDLNFFSLYALLLMTTKVTCTPVHDQIDNINSRGFGVGYVREKVVHH
jgi:hypothetical protein